MSKRKPIYSVTVSSDTPPKDTYSCLMTLCIDFGLKNHYGTIWRSLRDKGIYDDGKLIIKKTGLIKSVYNKK